MCTTSALNVFMSASIKTISISLFIFHNSLFSFLFCSRQWIATTPKRNIEKRSGFPDNFQFLPALLTIYARTITVWCTNVLYIYRFAMDLSQSSLQWFWHFAFLEKKNQCANRIIAIVAVSAQSHLKNWSRIFVKKNETLISSCGISSSCPTLHPIQPSRTSSGPKSKLLLEEVIEQVIDFS